ncbi:MAG: immunoglobulin-like domain-containing protein [Ruminococcus sp.]
MKRLVSLFLLSAFMLLAFAGCGNSEGEKSNTSDTATTTVAKSNISATVELSKTDYSQDVEKIDFTVTNNSDDTIYFGDDFLLEVKEGDKWTEPEIVAEYMKSSDDLLRTLDKGKSIDESLYVSERYGTLLYPGEYRLVVTVSTNENLTENPTKLYAPFEVKLLSD